MRKHYLENHCYWAPYWFDSASLRKRTQTFRFSIILWSQHLSSFFLTLLITVFQKRYSGLLLAQRLRHFRLVRSITDQMMPSKKRAIPGRAMYGQTTLIFTHRTHRNHKNHWGCFSLNDSMRGQRATGKTQRNNYHHRKCGPFLKRGFH